METKTQGKVKKKSQFQLIVKRFCKNKIALAGFFAMAFILLSIIVAIVFCDYNNAIAQDILLRYGTPSLENGFNGLLGYDYMGRSMIWRVLFGGKTTLLAAFSVVLLSLIVGGTIGAVCGFFGGKTDTVVMRLMDFLQCIPYIIMAMVIVAVLGSSIVNLVIALTLANIPIMARVVRSSVLNIREMDYIEAAYVAGSSRFGIIMRHVLPNAFGPIIIFCTLLMANQILSISALSFLGLGVQPPAPEWGYMISDASSIFRVHPHLTFVPGAVIVLSVLSINLIGDGIQAAIDPKLN